MRISYKFWPVGQGLFSSGVVDLCGQQRLRWVYDCGTVSAQKYIDCSIDKLEKAWVKKDSGGKKPRIDLLVISHFDQDHVSGLVNLLKNFSVGTLLLPYMPLWQRLLHALTAGIKIDSELMVFFISPASYISNIPEAEVTELIFIPPSAGEVSAETPPQEGDDQLQGIRRDAQTDEESLLGQNKYKPVVKFLASQKIVFNKVWEFLPYNDAQVLEKSMPKSMRDFQTSVASLIVDLLKQKTDTVLLEIKAIYDTQFGKGSRNRNLISLFIYAGPVASSRAFEICGCATAGKKRRPFFRRRGETDLRTSILYTGDGFLNTPTRLNALKTHLGAYRLKRLLCFQVMHHGSKGNWQPGLAEQFAPAFSIFSSDPGNQKTKHPHRVVKNDFKKYESFLVNKYSFKLDFFVF